MLSYESSPSAQDMVELLREMLPWAMQDLPKSKVVDPLKVGCKAAELREVHVKYSEILDIAG